MSKGLFNLLIVGSTYTLANTDNKVMVRRSLRLIGHQIIDDFTDNICTNLCTAEPNGLNVARIRLDRVRVTTEIVKNGFEWSNFHYQ